MPSLRDVQKEFYRAMSKNGLATPDWVVAAQKEKPSESIEIYRANTTIAKTAAFKAIYPVVAQLVGDEFFRAMSLEYVRTHDSTSGDLNHFGHEFASFIAIFPPASALPYLADVAQIEWQAHQVYLEKDAEPRTREFLSGVLPSEYGKVRFRLAYACRLLDLNWPADEIWLAHQNRREPMAQFYIDKARYYSLVTRNHAGVQVRRLSQVEWEFLRSIQNESTLGDIVERLFKLEIDFDLGALLQQFVADDTLVDGWLATSTD